MEKSDISNRFKYHAPKDGQLDKYIAIREAAKGMAELVNDLCVDCREKSLAVTAIEEAVMWANAGIARN